MVVVQVYPQERRAFWDGVLQCGRQHSCPVCAERRAAKRARELDDLMRSDPDGRWQMLTMTVRHSKNESLREIIERLFDAWRFTRTTRAVREVFKKRVSASVRALEVTYGKNGWHPHIHLLLRTADWLPGERELFADAWTRALGSMQKRGIGVVWSAPLRGKGDEQRARYIAKLGAEVAGLGKEARRGNLTPWQVAHGALSDESERALWTEYQTTMHGRRILEFDERAKAIAALAEAPTEPVSEMRIELLSEEVSYLARAERRCPSTFWDVVEAAQDASSQDEAEEWVREHVTLICADAARPLARATLRPDSARSPPARPEAASGFG